MSLEVIFSSFFLFKSNFDTLVSFACLRFVVVDEAHSYKGAFGCHTALILRRLHRLCSHGTFSLLSTAAMRPLYLFLCFVCVFYERSAFY